MKLRDHINLRNIKNRKVAETPKNKPCNFPFKNLYLWENFRFSFCCWSKDTYRIKGRSIEELWSGEEAKAFRESVYHGSYSLCRETCPWLDQIRRGNTGFYNSKAQDNQTRGNNQSKFLEGAEVHRQYRTGKIPLKYVQSAMSESCNYQCPSCRNELKTAQNSTGDKYTLTMEAISFLSPNSMVYLGGAGETLITKETLDILRNATDKELKNVAEILVVTNGSLLNKRMYESWSEAVRTGRKLTVNFSLDASSSEVYETKVRVGGKWDGVMDNLAYISEEFRGKPDRCLMLSFVVQADNFKDMPGFIELAKACGANYSFNRIDDWGHLSADLFKGKDVLNKNHPQHPEFLEVVKGMETKYGFKWKDHLPTY